MGLALITVFVLFPIIELTVLVKVGGAIGILQLLLLLAAMAVLGGLILRSQGIAVARRAMQDIDRGEAPVQSMIDGIGLSLAGLLMIVPGLVSDVLALLLLIPAVRRAVVGRLLGFASFRSAGPFRHGSGPGPQAPQPEAGQPRGPTGPRGPTDPHEGEPGARPSAKPVVIDGEFERLDERTVRPDRDTSGSKQRPRKDDSPWRH